MLGKALKRTRQFHRMNQTELAGRLGISKSHLSEIESGKKNPQFNLLKKYSDIFGIPVSSFVLFAETIETGQPNFKPAHKVMKIMDWIAKDFDEDCS